MSPRTSRCARDAAVHHSATVDSATPATARTRRLRYRPAVNPNEVIDLSNEDEQQWLALSDPILNSPGTGNRLHRADPGTVAA